MRCCARARRQVSSRRRRRRRRVKSFVRGETVNGGEHVCCADVADEKWRTRAPAVSPRACNNCVYFYRYRVRVTIVLEH